MLRPKASPAASGCISVHRFLITSLILLGLSAPKAQATNALDYTKNYFVTGDAAFASVGGLRGKGVNGFATGTLTMSGVPCISTDSTGRPTVVPCPTTATPGIVQAETIAAYLYWETIETSPSPVGAKAFFDGNPIVGSLRGSPNNAACWSSGGTSGNRNSAGRVYRADVRQYLPLDSNKVRVANGKHTIRLPDKGGNGNGSTNYSDGATLVVIYRITVPGYPLLVPLRAVSIYDGAYTTTKFLPVMFQNIGGFYDAFAGKAKMTHIVANGKSTSRQTLLINNAIVKNPKTGKSPFTGTDGDRWDSPTFEFNLASHASSASTLLISSDDDDDDRQACLTWLAIVVSAIVTDTDNDGLLDSWETKGLHLNPAYALQPFGGCSGLPSYEQCVNLPAMGANPNKKDIFLEIDYFHGTSGGDHTHKPKIAALSGIATTFAGRGIQLHFDVGSNYQTNAFNPASNPQGFIVPAALSRGGEVIEESSLLCPNNLVSNPGLCAYLQPYSVLSWKVGFKSVRDGNSKIGLPARFNSNRKDIFHYALFGHAIGGPYDSVTGKPLTRDPGSISGVADKLGADMMVTLGLWPSDDPVGCSPEVDCTNQTGSAKVQAGTLMHELGHNLGLLHAGNTRAPNCQPGYPSIMNYMHQVSLLTGPDGLSYLDYSQGSLNSLNENALSEAPGALGALKYRVRYYAPRPPVGTAATRNCDGSPAAPNSFVVRLESPAPLAPGGLLATPDWNNNGKVDAGTFAQDINFNSFIGDAAKDSVDPSKLDKSDPTKRWFVDSNDWASLNLQQIGSRSNLGGLSSEGGVFEDVGGVFEDVGGVFEDVGGVFADVNGVFEDVGGVFEDVGGVFEDVGGVFEDVGGVLVGDVDHETISGVPPATGTEPGSLLQATVYPTVPAPGGLTGVTLNWGAPDPSLAQIRYYRIYRTTDPTVLPTTAIASTPVGTPPLPTFKDDTIQFNTTYTYFVTSVTINGTESVLSTPASAMVKHLFITADSQTRTYGLANPPFTFTTDPASQDPGLTGLTTCNAYTDATFTTIVGPTTATGTYPIHCSGLTPAAGVTYTDGVLTIKPQPLTVTAKANTKDYDGNITAAAIPTITLGTLAPGDTGTFTETYDNKNPGTAKTLTPAGSVTNPANYIITFVPVTTGVINKAPLTITAVANTKDYDGNTTAAAIPTITLGTLAPGDTGTFTETYDNKDIGTGKTLTPSGSVTNSANYILTFVPVNSGVINKTTLTITATANTKQYDGNNTAAAIPTITAGTLAPGDTATFTETYDNKNTGTGKTLIPAGSVTNSANYTLNFVSINTGVINKAPLTITATTNTKTYNGNTSAAAIPVVNGLKTAADSVTGAAEAYADPNAGTGKTLVVSAYTLNDGNSGNNYAVTLVPNTTGVINKATATITVTPYSVVYDGIPHTATGLATGVGGANLNALLNLAATMHTAPGTYNADPWTFTDPGGNYNPASGSINDAIRWTFALTPITSPAKLGGIVPINWTLKNAAGGFITDLSTLVKVESIFNGSTVPTSGCVASLTGTAKTLYVIPTGATGKSTFQAVTNGFKFNWNTSTLVTTGAGCYTVRITLNDGTSKMTNGFRLKKYEHDDD